MSYILEALKKSDAERKRGEVPTLSNTQIDPASLTPSSGPSVVLIVAGVVGVLIAGGVGTWLMLADNVKPEPAQQIAQPAIEEPAAQPPAPVQQTPTEQASVMQASPAEQPPIAQTAPTPTVEPSKVEQAVSEPAATTPPPAPVALQEPAPQPAPEVVVQPKPLTATEKPKTTAQTEPEPMPEPQEVATLNAKAAPAPTVESKSAPLREPTLPTAGMKAEAKSGAKNSSAQKDALKNAKVLVDRAWTSIDQGLYAQALTDLDQALVSDPAYAEAWFARGWALEKSGDETAAIVDYGRAIDAKPGHAMALFSRGFLHLYGGNPQDAVVDFVRIQGVAKDESLRLYSHLWLYLSRVRANQNAQERLKSDTAQASLTQWPGPLIMHFLGNMNESAVLTFIEQGTKAGLKERRTTGYFFLGISAEISGDKDRARTYFEKTLATGALDFRQYDAAGRELKKLR